MWSVDIRAKVVASTALCLVLAGCDFRDFESSERFQSDFHYSYPLQPGGRLEVENFNGAVEITGWDQPTCEISGSKSASSPELRDRIKVEVSQTSNMIYVRSVRPPGNFTGNMGVRYVIQVPRKTELSRIISSNGPIHVADVGGPAELKTSNGGIRVDSLQGGLNIHTSNGGVTVDDIGGPMSLHTSNGSIRAERARAGIDATTSNGSITANFSDQVGNGSTPVKLETNNGRIEIGMEAPPRSDIRAHTSNNSITVRLPSLPAARLRVETTHGQVHSDFQANDARADEHGRRQTLDEDIGSGGPVIDLHTSNGSIRLLKKM